MRKRAFGGVGFLGFGEPREVSLNEVQAAGGERLDPSVADEQRQLAGQRGVHAKRRGRERLRIGIGSGFPRQRALDGLTQVRASRHRHRDDSPNPLLLAAHDAAEIDGELLHVDTERAFTLIPDQAATAEPSQRDRDV